MTHKLLTKKSRVIFTLLLGLPLIILALIPLEKVSLEIITISTTFILFVSYFWIYNIGNIVIQNSPVKRISVKLFRIILVYIFCFIFIPGILMLLKLNDEIEFNFVIILIIMLLTLLYIILSFYIIYVIANSLKSIELNKKANVYKTIGTFILLFYFPITAWFLHGKVIRILNKSGIR